MVPPEQDQIKPADTLQPNEMTRAIFPACSRIMAIGLIIILLTVVTGCNKSKKTETISETYDPEVTPTMVTRPVTTLISDSGITRYRITAPVWYVYDEAADPKWRFPEGMNMEKFDNLFRQEATVRCDSAIYLTRKQLWQLDGYVHIENVVGEQFLTQQLFWDQRSRKIYSDSFIHILRADRVIEGYGFESDEQMEHYKVRQVQGIFPVSQFQNGNNPPTNSSHGATVSDISDSEPLDSVTTEDLTHADDSVPRISDPIDTHRPTQPRHKRVLRPADPSLKEISKD